MKKLSTSTRKRQKIVGAAIRAGRKKANLSQEVMATILGCTRQCVSLWESGKRGLSYDQAMAVQRLLQIEF